ncbi:RING finger protein 32, partial [Clarias magur]
FQELSESLVRSCRSDVDSFLRDIDRSVTQSRGVFHLFDRLRAGAGTQDGEWLKAQEK